MKRIGLGFAALLFINASPALAQAPANTVSGAWRTPNFAIATPATAPSAGAQTGHGFTVLVDLGVGIQHDAFFGETKTGLAGLNVQAGWFIKDNVAVMGVFAGTRVNFDDFETRQSSGVAGGLIQYWTSDRMAIEFGAGSGFWSDDNGDSDRGLGLIVGVRWVVLERGPHHILLGAQYVPVLTESKVHNVSVTAAYQFFKKR